MPPHVNLQYIITFYFVAHEGSFSSAADKLCVTESAVHQQIRGLELYYKVKLVYVKKKRAYLTSAGERLFPYAESLFKQLMAIDSFLEKYRVNSLHIGVSGTLMVYLVSIINKFKELYPTVQITLQQGPSMLLMEELVQFRHDICLVGSLHYVDESLRVLRIPEVEELVLVTGPQHPLACGPPATWEDLTHYPLIVQHEGTCGRRIIEQKFSSNHLTPFIGAEVDNIECAKRLAQQGMGIALMFLPNVKEEIAQGTLKIIPMVDGKIKLGIDILTNRMASLSQPGEAFLNVILEHFRPELQEISKIGISG